MKKIKILGILILIIFLNGCSATYSLNISDSTINESLSIKMNNSEFATFMENNNNKYVIPRIIIYTIKYKITPNNGLEPLS